MSDKDIHDLFQGLLIGLAIFSIIFMMGRCSKPKCTRPTPDPTREGKFIEETGYKINKRCYWLVDEELKEYLEQLRAPIEIDTDHLNAPDD